MVKCYLSCHYRPEQVFHQVQTSLVAGVAPVEDDPVHHGKTDAQMGRPEGCGKLPVERASHHEGRD